MPNPKLETYKNKATGDVYDYTDADAQGKLTAILDGTTIDSFADVESALADKVDAVAGKGLSTNDYDDTEKAKVAAAFPRSEQAVLGAKNLCPKGVSKTQNEVTFTVADDGIIDVNGTAYGDDSYNIVTALHGDIYSKPMIISGCPANGSDNTYSIDVIIRPLGGGSAIDIYHEYGNGASVRPLTSNEQMDIRIGMHAGAVYNHLTFKPMLRLATDTDPTYAPYAMTNRELTDAVQWKESVVSLVQGITSNGNKVIRTGNVVEVYLTIPMQDVTSADKVVGILPFKPANIFAFVDIFDSAKPYEIIGKALLRPSTNELVIPQGVQTSATNIFITGTYICTD